MVKHARTEVVNYEPLAEEDYGLGPDKSGVTVIPFADSGQFAKLRSELARYIDNMPEFNRMGEKPKDRETNKQVFEPVSDKFRKETVPNPSTFDNDMFYPVEGGFGAMGNSSSFHNPFVRKVRMAAHVAVLVSKTIPIASDENFEQVPDRLMVRRSDKEPTEEAWAGTETRQYSPSLAIPFTEDGSIWTLTEIYTARAL